MTPLLAGVLAVGAVACGGSGPANGEAENADDGGGAPMDEPTEAMGDDGMDDGGMDDGGSSDDDM